MHFGKIAIKEGYITRKQLNRALAIQKEKKDWQLGEILAFLGYLEDWQMQSIRSMQGKNSAEPTKTDPQDASRTKEPVGLITPTRLFPHKERLRSESRIFGRYRIIAEIGSGGMGRVYKAYDMKLGRLIALKVLISGGAASQQQIERFLREARATARLRHPNIVGLYDIGSVDGQNFFTMDFLEGLSLKVFLKKNSPSIEQIVTIMIKVGKAVHYAHTQDIIHRDIKPSNIMINVDHEPKIMDFGLAKMVSANDNLSKTGDILGTPAYMSPEQSESKTTDSRSDVYSLGATLYEALAGRPPFQGESYVDILNQIVHSDPPALRKSNPAISAELEAICFKCLEKEPAKRYQSSLVFVSDLMNFLDSRPIIAKPPSRLTYLKKLILARRTSQILTLITAVIVLLGGIFFFAQWRFVKKSAQRKCREMQIQVEQAKIRMGMIALSEGRKHFRKRHWHNAGAYAGMSLEQLKDLQSIEVECLREQSKQIIYCALQNLDLKSKISEDSLENALQKHPQRITRELFGVEIMENYDAKAENAKVANPAFPE